MALSAIRPYKEEILKLLANNKQEKVIEHLQKKYGIKTSPPSITRLKQEAAKDAECADVPPEINMQTISTILTQITSEMEDLQKRFELHDKRSDVGHSQTLSEIKKLCQILVGKQSQKRRL